MKEALNIFFPEKDSLQSFAFQSNFNSVYALETLLKKIKKQINIPSSIYCNICISVIEAISNAIIHGNKLDNRKKVFLFIQLKKNDWICFTVKDEGNGFDFENIPSPNLDMNKKKAYGSGIFFMKKLANLTFFSEKGTAVDLYFNLNAT